MADLQEEKSSQAVEKSEMDLAFTPDVVGIIDTQTAALIGLPKAGFVILKEEDIKHIEARHGEQIKNAEFNSVRDFVAYVLSHIDAVYEGTNEAYAFIAQGVKHNDRVLTILEITEDGTGSDLYTIKTAHPINRKFYKSEGRHRLKPVASFTLHL